MVASVVLNSINAFCKLWDPFDLAADPHAASAGCPLEKEDGSIEVKIVCLSMLMMMKLHLSTDFYV